LKFSNKETGCAFPECCGQTAPNASAAFALGIKAETRKVTGEPEKKGADRQWLLIRRLLVYLWINYHKINGRREATSLHYFLKTRATRGYLSIILKIR
jgi:hypothetical protein